MGSLAVGPRIEALRPASISALRGEAGGRATDSTVGRPYDLVSAVSDGYGYLGLPAVRGDTGCDCDLREIWYLGGDGHGYSIVRA